ncbi:PEP-CTERM sorting domain-containing protein [Pelomonas sp. KK5]|uniref:PEP-CTERM sorting domain-containing protein n=1 Tax=Pelomonas sp. KK5 TaxID=1855730 RepID=UPI00097C32AE|nr:PEP-CTERM sorting domain-containing protein [Pelomonas sp. KK5]
MHIKSSIAIAALAALGVALPASAAELVSNGGFEAGSLTGWSGSVLSNPYSGVYCAGAGSAPEGSCEAFLGTDGASDTLSQVLSTVAGQSYTISFAFQGDGSTPSSLSVSFGGQSVYEAISPASTALQTLSFTASAAGASTPLVFTFRNDPGYFIVDAVSVTAVPEPASMTLAALGLVGLAARRRWAARAAT